MPSSGFLFLDRNGNGIADNGTELFGPTSGDGFTELSALDEDGNSWIDSGDSAFKDLQIWTKSADGKDSYFSLSDKGVSALGVDNIAADFTFTGNDNSAIAKSRKLGICLAENGGGTIQQVDFAV